MKISAVLFFLTVPVIIFLIHKKFPNNRMTIYLIPEILSDQKHPKAKLRKVGIAYIIIALWLIFITISISFLFQSEHIESFPWLMAILYFAIPIISFAALIIGFYYLFIGIFSKSDYNRPRFESITYAEKEFLEKYIKKLKVYTVINLLCLFLLIILIPISVLLDVSEKGLMSLINVSLLIAFIMTLWRIRAYIVKSATAMDLSANKYFLSTLFNPFAFFIVWFHSIFLIRRFRQLKSDLSVNVQH